MRSIKAEEGHKRRNKEYREKHKDRLRTKRLARYPEIKARIKELAIERKELTGHTTTLAHRKAARKWYIKQKYGILEEELLLIKEKQKGQCAICDRVLVGKDAHIDHCHITGVVRGWLCGRCNMGLGLFDEDTGRLRKAVEYLSV